VAAGFEAPMVRAIIERIRRNQFKRTTPPIAYLKFDVPGWDFVHV